MKTATKNTVKEKPEAKPEMASATEVAAKSEPTQPSNGQSAAKGFTKRETNAGSERMSIKIVADKISSESLQPKTIERLREVLKNTYQDPEMRSFAGITGIAATPEGALEIISSEAVGNLLNMTSGIEAFIASGRTKLPYDTCIKFLEFDEREHRYLDKQIARQLNAHVPPEWLSKADLYICLGNLISLTMIKFKLLGDFAAAQNKNKVDVELDKIERATKKDEARTQQVQTAEIPLDFIPPPPPTQSQGQSYERPA